MWTSWCDYILTSNTVIVSYFHGKPEDDDFTKNHIQKLLSSQNKINLIITSSMKNKKRLINWGICKDKILIIPIGVNTKLYKKFKPKVKNKILNKYKLPKDRIIIGSFQKDGVGWGEGLKPKLIKGPDLL